ncbi:MAG: polymerase [bacterium]|nr:polymerase [bacterium]
MSEDIEDLAKKGKLTEIPGIGKDLAAKIMEFLSTGRIADYEKLKKGIPPTLLELLSVPGVGPKKAKLFYERLGIKSVRELEDAAKKGMLAGLPGVGAKTEEKILKGISLWRKSRERRSLGRILPLAQEIIAKLSEAPSVKKISAAGSLRRMKDTVKDLDILVVSTEPMDVMKRFVSLPFVMEVLGMGPTKSSILTNEAFQVDLRVVPEESFGAALQYFTGSKNHNIHLRQIAIKKGLKVSEYGVFKENDEKIAGYTEEDVYHALGLPWIPPELREDRGEIEAALEGNLPKLIEITDIKGDLHVHSKWSDGAHSIEELVQKALERGYKYIAITDHSKALGVARGLDEERVLKQIEEIRAIQERYHNIKILAGIEVDILQDGSLDLPDEILSKLDIVIASVHSAFNMSQEEMTRRICKALSNPYVDILGHPTGRLIEEREGYQVDIMAVLQKAREENVALEINAFPQRLDLNDINAKIAKEMGVKLAINTDAHTWGQFDFMVFGVATARRGWLEKEDVINAWDTEELLRWLQS